MINVISVIWLSQNCRIFKNFVITYHHAISLVVADTHLAGTYSKGTMSKSIEKFRLLKYFSVACHPCKAPTTKKVNWYRPVVGWIKCNTDGSTRGSPGHAAAGGIFRDLRSSILGC